jgi:hypothetical protein
VDERYIAWTESYPDREVARWALQAASEGLHGPELFVGDSAKAVDQEDRALSPDKAATIRAKHMKEVGLGQEVGPLRGAWASASRLLPQGCVKKDRYDPMSQRWRSTVDPSALHDGFCEGSINDLTYSPRLLSAHLSAEQMRDTLAWIFSLHGPGVQAYAADIPACFRLMRLHVSLLPLFLYRVVTEEHGTEFFGDLCCPFGWTASEWGWQCILGLILWRFHLAGLTDIMSFVDNFYDFSHPSMGVLFEERRQKIEGVFSSLGIPPGYTSP